MLKFQITFTVMCSLTLHKGMFTLSSDITLHYIKFRVQKMGLHDVKRCIIANINVLGTPCQLQPEQTPIYYIEIFCNVKSDIT